MEREEARISGLFHFGLVTECYGLSPVFWHKTGTFFWNIFSRAGERLKLAGVGGIGLLVSA